ncbi:hypothetical protein HK099_000650 [Clydaea vesicula]|uniref:GDT1 family protein n=1 Tax=Clydaea vesicula TaxID=447962 RepID=A0AAD5U4C8_9FUNG|nr:hypothetical protein HK099_000650 [Clydaea vesicula]KAJ3395779.1 hypothetical protein HDU92_004942 [Lobulomyces angularis]
MAPIPISSNAKAGVSSFLVILVSEIGDKTFLIAAILAMTNKRLLIFTAAFAALFVMTILSAFLGIVGQNLLNKKYTQILAGILFFVFGVKMLLDARKMTGKELEEETEEVSKELLEKEEEEKEKKSSLEEGNISKKESTGFAAGIHNLLQFLFSPVFIQTFVMTFLAEWGDRSQIATIALAGAEDFLYVTLGGLCGHAICTCVAVVGGRLLASKISIKTVTIMGGILFLIFGFTTFYSVYAGEENSENYDIPSSD